MVVALDADTIIQDDSALREAVAVQSVTGGKDTNPLWTSEVSNENFMEALKQSLSVHTILANGEARYRLSAELQKLKQPFAGFDLTVTATVLYRLQDAATDELVYETVVETPYKAKMGDALYGAKRLQLANEGAIRENIKALISELIDQSKTNPALGGLAEPEGDVISYLERRLLGVG